MANSKYEYVKTFEQSNRLLPDTYIIVRIDGRGFHKLVANFCRMQSTQLILLYQVFSKVQIRETQRSPCVGINERRSHGGDERNTRC